MIYCHCTQCGMRFRKGRKKHPVCPRCGKDDFWEDEIPSDDLTLADQIADRNQNIKK